MALTQTSSMTLSNCFLQCHQINTRLGWYFGDSLSCPCCLPPSLSQKSASCWPCTEPPLSPHRWAALGRKALHILRKHHTSHTTHISRTHHTTHITPFNTYYTHTTHITRHNMHISFALHPSPTVWWFTSLHSPRSLSTLLLQDPGTSSPHSPSSVPCSLHAVHSPLQNPSLPIGLPD